MSLIDEALKRAEREQPRRHGGERPGDPGPTHKDGPAQPAEAPQKPSTRLARVAMLGIALVAAVAMVTYLSLPPEQKTPTPATAGSTPAASQPAERLGRIEIEKTEISNRAAGAPARPAQPRFGPQRITAPGPATQLAQEHPGRAGYPPTAPKSKSRPPEFRLGGIMRSGGLANALINNRLVAAGDAIDGARVVSIEMFHVVLEKDGKQFVLRM